MVGSGVRSILYGYAPSGVESEGELLYILFLSPLYSGNVYIKIEQFKKNIATPVLTDVTIIIVIKKC